VLGKKVLNHQRRQREKTGQPADDGKGLQKNKKPGAKKAGILSSSQTVNQSGPGAFRRLETKMDIYQWAISNS
jgi:hypothetical protein